MHRQFNRERPDEAWLTDITEHATGEAIVGALGLTEERLSSFAGQSLSAGLERRVGTGGNIQQFAEVRVGSDAFAGRVFGQRYDSQGAALGTEFRVNAFTTGTQSRPSAASDGRMFSPGDPPTGRDVAAARPARALAAALDAVDGVFDRVYSSALNPLYRTGTLAVLFLALALVTGVYLLLVYDVARRRGMSLFTLTDHDSIAGALALAGRPDVFVSEELTLELTDAFLPDCAGTWTLTAGADGASVARSSRTPDLALDTTDLAAMYLGTFRATRLARAGRVRELRAGAAARADALFATDIAPWCSKVF